MAFVEMDKEIVIALSNDPDPEISNNAKENYEDIVEKIKKMLG